MYKYFNKNKNAFSCMHCSYYDEFKMISNLYYLVLLKRKILFENYDIFCIFARYFVKN